MPTRRPRSAKSSTGFPSLAALTAGGVLASGCHAPQCGDSRGEELTAHGGNASRALRRGHGGEAFRELGVGLGLRAHDALPVVNPPPPVMGGGAVASVTEVPVVTPTPPVANEVMAPGQMIAVGPEPPTHPDPTPVARNNRRLHPRR